MVEQQQFSQHKQASELKQSEDTEEQSGLSDLIVHVFITSRRNTYIFQGLTDY